MLTRCLQHALHLFQLIQFCLHYFCTVSHFLLVCLCDRVDDVPFEGEQEQVNEEEQQQFSKEGKWPSYSAYSILSQQYHVNSLYFIIVLHKLDRIATKDIT